MTRMFVRAVLGLGVCGMAFGQPVFDGAEVRISAPGATPTMTGGLVRGGRYELLHATMLDLIRTAWGVGGDNVIGGPDWLERDRFDIIAKTAPTASPDTIPPMLRALLRDHFALIVRDDTKALPAFALTADKHPKLKTAEGIGNTGCQMRHQSMSNAGKIENFVQACQNVTMAEFAERIRGIAGSYVNHPVVDQTGLAGKWDFNITFTAQQLLGLAGADGITFFDAIDKQLGLKLERKSLPMPVVVVVSVNEKPTGTTAATQTGPATPMEFEVAEIKLSEPGTPERFEFQAGGRIHMQSGSLKEMTQLAWSIHGDDMLVGAPGWLDTQRFDLVARAPASTQAVVGVNSGVSGPPMDIEALRLMMRAMLKDRFKMAAHNEERPASVYALVTGKPKMNKADPSNRQKCKQATGRAGKGAAIVSTFSYTCQNTTMAQFAKQLGERSMADLTHPVVDATGLEGAWDFELVWTPRVLAPGGAAGSDPTGALTLDDALDRQLGLKLEMQKRPVTVLVIDHVEQKPTDN